MKETGDTKQDIPTIFIRTKPIANLLTVLEASARNKARTFSHSGTYAGIPPHLHTISLLLRLWRFFCCFELFLLRLCRQKMRNQPLPSFLLGIGILNNPPSNIGMGLGMLGHCTQRIRKPTVSSIGTGLWDYICGSRWSSSLCCG